MQPSTSFNVSLSPKIIGEISSEQQRLAENITELRNYDTTPHLSVATKFMPPPQTEEYAHALVREFEHDLPWDMEFAGFSAAATGNYLFLNLSDASREMLFKLHDRAFTATKAIGDEGQTGPTPKYPYDPHISLIKLNADAMALALQLLGTDFSGKKMRVTSYFVTRQDDTEDGYSNFPVVATIQLAHD